VIEVGEDMITKARQEKAWRWKTGNGWWEEPKFTEVKTNPSPRLNNVIAKGRSSRPHVKTPRRVTSPSQSRGRKIIATIQIGRKSDEVDEARRLELRGWKIDEEEDRIEPSKLSRKIKEWATAINTSHARMSIKEPIQGEIHTGRIENCGGVEEGQRARECAEREHGTKKELGRAA
jgi:hypothetical protein